ncbi:hypothetical protein PV08_08534 [Exophiala spinifera]|uniref:Cyclase n=1 Tax=Exophiala spinifera TaxID=91928 RepID=A0A0D1YE29_9EURO|nr:uncharacterized protein PV08_08534 [Exophiala spinifera]KIW13346.1 hypothetical protein PV08_08534 [Exophiala spinifera]
MKLDTLRLPSWEDIPEVPGMPHGCIWGMFDQGGQRDQLGTLNLLTPMTVMKAKEEIQTGESVCLNWGFEHPQTPGVNRKKFSHSIISLRHLGYVAYDDEVSINTQSGSQWDGFRHWGHQATGLHYNDLPHDDITDLKCKDNSIHYWSERGGIVGRGVLIDYHSWAVANNVEHPAIRRTPLTVADIERVAQHQGVQFRQGDILIIRTGWTEWYNNSTGEEQAAGTQGNEHIGLDSTEETVKSLWSRHFAAVASDTLAFEAWPTQPPYSETLC